jgi:hypothetical protein
MERISKGDLKTGRRGTEQTPRKSSESERYAKKPWRAVSPLLAELTHLEYRKLRICCPECEATKENCRACGGGGYVCPTCRGARYLGLERKGDASVLRRCFGCGVGSSQGDGWEYDPYRELLTIEAWLEKWQIETARKVPA